MKEVERTYYMGKGTFESRYSRKDLLKEIKKNGGTAAGLDLSNKCFEDNVDFSNLKLDQVILRDTLLPSPNFSNSSLICSNFEGALLVCANFKKSDCSGANFKNAHLERAYLNEVRLYSVNLEETNLNDTKISDAELAYIRLSNKSKLENVNWGDYLTREERNGDKKKGNIAYYNLAQDTYRNLKLWYTEHGIYDVAGNFFYREMEVKRKSQIWKNKLFYKLWLWAIRTLCGYGEKPERVVISAASLVLICAFIFFGLNSWSAFGHSLYFSAVSFTALGYGSWIDSSWIDISSNWIKGIGVTESFLGVFMMALFLVTFTRKMTR